MKPPFSRKGEAHGAPARQLPQGMEGGVAVERACAQGRQRQNVDSAN